jgi:hypothetical protein
LYSCNDRCYFPDHTVTFPENLLRVCQRG